MIMTGLKASHSGHQPHGLTSRTGSHPPVAAGLTWLKSEYGTAFLLVGPVLLLFAFSAIYPLIETIRLSFFDIVGLGKPKYVGFGNFVRLFRDANFLSAMKTTFVWTLSTTVISVGIGWCLAMLCAFAPKATLPARVMIFTAYGISESVSGFIWLGIFRPDKSGLLNAILTGLGQGDLTRAWLGDPSTALGALIATYSWAQVGLPLMICFAAAQAVPKSILEAAYMDGANHFSIMRHIIVPLSMPGVRVAVFINLLGSLRAFDTIFILTGGGPVRSTETVGFFMYRESMTQFKLGYGAAATVVLLAAVLVVSIPAILQRTAASR